MKLPDSDCVVTKGGLIRAEQLLAPNTIPHFNLDASASFNSEGALKIVIGNNKIRPMGTEEELASRLARRRSSANDSKDSGRPYAGMIR